MKKGAPGPTQPSKADVGISPSSLEFLVRRHGILLEHEVHQALTEYAESRSRFQGPPFTALALRERLDAKINGDKVSLDVDVDAAAAFRTRYEPGLSVTGIGGTREKPALEEFALNELRTVIIAECKGHESTGFLLTRLIAPSGAYETRHEIQQYIHFPHVTKGDRDARFKQVRHLVSDWAQFYVRKTDQSEVPKTLLGVKPFQESKDKFRTAIRQSLEGVALAITSPNVFSSDRQTGFQVSWRPLPLIVTNAPIIGMRREGKVVTFHKLPWFVHKNQPYQLNGYEPRVYYDFSHTYVCSFSQLTKFLDNFLSTQPDAFDAEKDYLAAALHSFTLDGPDGVLADAFPSNDDAKTDESIAS